MERPGRISAQRLVSFGVAAMIAAALLTALQWYLPSTAPDPTEAQKLAPDTYKTYLDSMMWQFSLKVYAGYFGDRFLSAGFLMWLAGTALKIRGQQDADAE